jgi:hypothetical protein
VFRKIIVVLSFSIFLPLTDASAQQNELGFVLGGTFSPDAHAPVFIGAGTCPIPNFNCTISRRIHVDSGVSFEGVYGRRVLEAPFASLYLELPVVGIPARRLNPTLASFPAFPPVPTRSDLAAIFVTPSLKAKFLAKAPVSAFISIGGGLAHYRSNFEFSPQNTGLVSTTTGALQFGGGLDIKTPLEPLVFRLEVRDFQAGDPGTGFGQLDHRHNIFAGVGAVFRF